MALIGWSAAAYHLKGWDGWIGWDDNQRRARLHLVANNARFCRLGPKGQYPNLASRALALNLERLSADWGAKYGHRIVVVESFVDLEWFRGTARQATGWQAVGTKAKYRRVTTRTWKRNTARLREMLLQSNRPADTWARSTLSAVRSTRNVARGAAAAPMADRGLLAKSVRDRGVPGLHVIRWVPLGGGRGAAVPPAAGSQLPDVALRMMGQTRHDVAEIGVGLHAEALATDHQGEEIRGPLPAGILADVQPVLTSHDDASQSVLDRVMPPAGLCRVPGGNRVLSA